MCALLQQTQRVATGLAPACLFVVAPRCINYGPTDDNPVKPPPFRGQTAPATALNRSGAPPHSQGCGHRPPGTVTDPPATLEARHTENIPASGTPPLIYTLSIHIGYATRRHDTSWHAMWHPAKWPLVDQTFYACHYAEDEDHLE